MSEQKTHFGFSTVNESEKAGKVAEVFHSVAKNYDIMNDVMSGACTACGNTSPSKPRA